MNAIAGGVADAAQGAGKGNARPEEAAPSQNDDGQTETSRDTRDEANGNGKSHDVPAERSSGGLAAAEQVQGEAGASASVSADERVAAGRAAESRNDIAPVIAKPGASINVGAAEDGQSEPALHVDEPAARQTAQQHQRQVSNGVTKVENPALTQQVQTEAPRPIVPTAGTNWPDQQNYNASVMHAEQSQNRHDLRSDRPASYQPHIPSSYLHIRALGLQLPTTGPSTSNNSNSHTEPPAVVLEARTNLSSARRSFYPRVTRTLPELQLWVLALTLSFPAGIFSPFSEPPTTLTSTSSASASANARHADAIATRNYLVTITRQFDRILRKPYVLSHPATVAFIDCDFSYNAAMPHVGPGSSQMSRRKMDDGTTLARMGHDPIRGRRTRSAGAGSVMSTWDIDGVVAALGLPNVPAHNGHDPYAQPAPTTSKNPLNIFSRANASPQRIAPQPQVPIPPGEEDEDEEDLTAARNEITRLELQFERASKAAQLFVERNGAMTATVHQLKQAMNDLANLDAGRPVARKTKQESATKALTHCLESWSAATSAQSAAVMSTLAPGLSYQSYNARTAIDALLRRASAAAHRYSMLVILVSRRREAERLKRTRGGISQEEVDWVLRELRDAQRSTQVLTHHLATFTATLKEELRDHSRNTHADIQEALLQQARSSMRAHRFALNNLIRTRDSLVAMREGRAVQDIAKSERLDMRPSSVEQHSASGLPAMPSANVPRPLPGKVPVRTSSASNSVDAAFERQPKQDAVGASQVPAQHVSDVVVPSTRLHTGPSHRAGNDLASEGMSPSQSSAGQITQAMASRAPLDTNVQKPLPPPSPSRQDQPLPPRPIEETLTRQHPAGTRPSPRETQLAPSPVPANNASQSMFLPGRNMQRYANPFARMDGSSSTFLGAGGGGSQVPPGALPRPAPGAISASSPAPSIASSRPPTDDMAEPEASQQPTSGPPGRAPDPWANRSRISASDAARSLAGRF